MQDDSDHLLVAGPGNMIIRLYTRVRSHVVSQSPSDAEVDGSTCRRASLCYSDPETGNHINPQSNLRLSSNFQEKGTKFSSLFQCFVAYAGKVGEVIYYTRILGPQIED